MAALARRAGVPFAGLWLEAPREILETRVGARSRDASDATVAVVRAQSDYETGPIDWTRLDAAPPPEAVIAAARRALAI
jgi:predicted kinase